MPLQESTLYLHDSREVEVEMTLRRVNKRTNVLLRLQDRSSLSTDAQLFILRVHAMQLESLDRPFQYPLHFPTRREFPRLRLSIERHCDLDFATFVAVKVMFILDAVVAQSSVTGQFIFRVFDENDRVGIDRHPGPLCSLEHVLDGSFFGNPDDFFLGCSRTVEVDFDVFNHCITW